MWKAKASFKLANLLIGNLFKKAFLRVKAKMKKIVKDIMVVDN